MGGKNADSLGNFGKLSARLPGQKGLRNSWENTKLSKNTKEDAVPSCRNQISKCKAHSECDPSSDRCCGRWFPAQTGGRAGMEDVGVGGGGLRVECHRPLSPGLHR